MLSSSLWRMPGWNESLVDANMVPLRRLLSIALDSGYVSEKSKQPIVVHCDSGKGFVSMALAVCCVLCAAAAAAREPLGQRNDVL